MKHLLLLSVVMLASLAPHFASADQPEWRPRKNFNPTYPQPTPFRPREVPPTWRPRKNFGPAPEVPPPYPYPPCGNRKNFHNPFGC